jgi:putative FmdB family regulatory protein
MGLWDSGLRGVEVMNVPVHVYECGDCGVLFAVEQALEDQSEICCPNCGTEEIDDVAAGELITKKS